jgi:nitrilase
MRSGRTVAANLEQADRLLAEARRRRAELALLPENFALMAQSDPERWEAAERGGRGPVQDYLSQTARRLGIALIGGTLPIRSGTRVYAASLAFDAHGRVIGRYDKMHLFDVDLGPGERYRESAGTRPGNGPQVVRLAGIPVGLSVCYDVRFPELYRCLVADGARLLTVPAAFTVPTGRAHWTTLLRARAIENQCYVLAAAQSGRHEGGRRTYGHSCLIDPWGRLVAERQAPGPGIVLGHYDSGCLEQIRGRLPALRHRRIHPAGTGPGLSRHQGNRAGR